MKTKNDPIDLVWFKEAFSKPMYVGAADKTIMKFVGLGLACIVSCHIDGNHNLYMLTRDGKIFYNERFSVPFGRFN